MDKSKTPQRINLKDKNGNKYTLEFDRDTVKRMVKRGFVLDTEPSHLVLLTEDLVTGAFQMHHKKMDWERIEPIWMAQNKRSDLLQALAAMFMKPANDLLGDDDEDNDENPTWEAEE